MEKIERYKQYRKLWTDTAKNLKAPPVPIHIDLELTKVCNLKCAMCPASTQKDNGMMDFHLAQSILKEAAEIGVSSIKMNWRGEPTLYPHFEQISRVAHSLGFVDIMLNTNGMYVNNNIKIALYNYYTTVVFSIDAYDTQIFRQCRSGASPDLIYRNFQEIAEHRQKYNKPEFLVLNHVRQKINWGEYNILKELCERKDIKFRAMLAFPRTDIELHDEEHKPNILGRKQCSFPFQRLTIAWNGNVYPCCCLWCEEDGESFGNVKVDSLMSIWDGDKLNDIREQEKRGLKINPICVEKCVSWLTFQTDKPTLFDSYEK